MISAVLVLALVVAGDAARLYMDKCDELRGFNCTKSPTVNGRLDVVFTCNPRTTWDVEFYLWQFRAISTISSFRIANCTNVILNLQCTSELRHIHMVRITNVTKLTIPSLVHGLTQTPAQFVLEDIGYIETIFTRTFIQIKKFPFNRFGCINPSKDLESVELRNVNIGTIEREAFHNLTGFKNFSFDRVTVGKIEANAALVYLDKGFEVEIQRSKITLMEYLAFSVRGDKFTFTSNTVKDIRTTAVKLAVFNFYFTNNTIGSVHCGAISALAQNVKILDSNFDYLASGAFQTIGPGLPENALQGFGDLDFTFEFKNNLVESLEIGSLNPDWRAYKKVGGHLSISYNALKCTCAELAWLGHKEGFGKEFSSLDEYHEKILDKENKNLCIDTPCILPVEAVRFLVIRDGRCLHNYTTKDLCNLYYPPSTTRRPSTRITYTTPYLQFFKRGKFSLKSKGLRPQMNLLFIINNIVFFSLYAIIS